MKAKVPSGSVLEISETRVYASKVCVQDPILDQTRFHLSHTHSDLRCVRLSIKWTGIPSRLSEINITDLSLSRHSCSPIKSKSWGARVLAAVGASTPKARIELPH